MTKHSRGSGVTMDTLGVPSVEVQSWVRAQESRVGDRPVVLGSPK